MEKGNQVAQIRRATAPPGEARPAACWSCQGPVAGTEPFCPTCTAVQPPAPVDHFIRLGLAVEFDVDETVLDRRYFDLQRQLHPDRFATRTPRERTLSQQQAVALNDAYETLKDPLRRADYLVHLKGSGVLPEGCHLVNDTALLTESMELREALADADTVEQVDGLERRARQDIADCIEQISVLFGDGDLEGACRLTTRLKYLRKLAEETRVRRAQIGPGV